MESISQLFENKSYKWLVTGAAGFIGSHLTEFLLKNKQTVIGLDNFYTGKQQNIDDVLKNISELSSKNFTFIEGDIRDTETCLKVTDGIDFVLHQAAVGSVPRSIAHPDITFDTNIRGFFEIFNACRINKVKKIVFASSSSVYGDAISDIRQEDKIGNALSPYAWSKQTNETLALNFRNVYQMDIKCLRYFNVFGPRQNPAGAYAAVIPKWIINSMKNEKCEIYGDGLQARDFCYIENVVQANIRAALMNLSPDQPWIFNIAYGQQTNLLRLKELINQNLKSKQADISSALFFAPRRTGDIKNSLADIGKARKLLNYEPLFDITTGLSKTVDWYFQNKNYYL